MLFWEKHSLLFSRCSMFHYYYIWSEVSDRQREIIHIHPSSKFSHNVTKTQNLRVSHTWDLFFSPNTILKEAVQPSAILNLYHNVELTTFRFSAGKEGINQLLTAFDQNLKHITLLFHWQSLVTWLQPHLKRGWKIELCFPHHSTK